MAANPNGSIAIVFTYNGTTFGSYADFLASFWVTLPGGGGVMLGPDQYFGYAPGAGNALTLGESYLLQKAASPITGLLPTNAVGNQNLAAAFASWAKTQAASPAQTETPSRRSAECSLEVGGLPAGGRPTSSRRSAECSLEVGGLPAGGRSTDFLQEVHRVLPGSRRTSCWGSTEVLS